MDEGGGKLAPCVRLGVAPPRDISDACERDPGVNARAGHPSAEVPPKQSGS